MSTTYDPLEGVTTKTTKEELVERLRKAAAWIRREDRKSKSKLEEIEVRLRQKFDRSPENLKQAIISSTSSEWTDLIAFLEEFEHEGLLPTAGQRIVTGGRVLLGQIPSEPDATQDAGT